MQYNTWNQKYGKSFKKALKFEKEQQGKLAFFYEAIQEKLGMKCEIEVLDFHKSMKNQRLQKQGVDTILYFENGNKLYVQEKHMQNNVDSIYLEYEKPDGRPSWALDNKERSQLLVFHYTRFGKAISVGTQKLVKLVAEKLPEWKFWYNDRLATHSDCKGIKLPINELMQYKEELGLQEYYKKEPDIFEELFGVSDNNSDTISRWLN